ncbi:hypothetical protein SRRS_02980 [Sporomusa rhizae]|uniref:heparan-alpha-glucosaminide N-acetyltransferase n=1 Tax=Sporomusa rhizae TaxID=357999 RepID=UPI00352B1110
MPKTVRIAEIDCCRGIAILLMIVFHLVFDLAYFYHWPLTYLDGFWYYQGKTAAILFMLLSGISSLFSSNPFRRGIMILATGAVISMATYFYDPASYIRFGTLHLLGVAMLASPLFIQLKAVELLIAGTVIIATGRLTATLTTPTTYLLPLGISPPDFASLDYYPLIPWLGIVLYGMAAGKLIYRNKQPKFPAAGAYRPVQWLSRLGKHSLIIYLVHQPILLLFLLAVYKLK